MGIQLKPGEDIGSYIARRQAELMGGSNTDASTTTPDFSNVQSGSSTQSTAPPEDERGRFERFAHDTYVAHRAKDEEARALFDADPGAYFDKYGKDASKLGNLLGGPSTRGFNIVQGTKNFVRKALQPRPTGAKVAEATGKVAAEVTPVGLNRGSLAQKLANLPDDIDNSVDLAGIAKGSVETFQDAQALGSRVMSKATLAMKTPDDFGRILTEVPKELLDDFYFGMQGKLIQAVKDMPRLTKDAQRNLLSPSGRNILKHTLQGMPDEEFAQLMTMLERGLWTEVRNKILKWGVGLPLLGYFSIRQILPKGN